MDKSILLVETLRKSYGQRSILHGINFKVKAGESVALMGPSGSGKTTLLNCLCGVEPFDSGEITLENNAYSTLNQDQLIELRQKHLGVVFQFFHLLPTLSLEENIQFPMQLAGLRDQQIKERCDYLMDRVGIEHRREAFPQELSGGEMQRTAIARAIAVKPLLLLADEPTGSLDSEHSEEILKLLMELIREEQTALFMVTHDNHVASFCDRLVKIKDGLLEQ
ncbi:MAG: ABC transporter ATP-binding protein [Lentisphaeria bacterium]|nr:ABC transporter ATP-binding protein [Lentisphaeria bacterium]